MSWTYHSRHKNLGFEVNSGSPFSDSYSEVVGFFIRDPATIEAIRSRDPRILDILNLMVDEIEELSLARWAGDHLSFQHWAEENDLDEYERMLKIILNSDYADSDAKSIAFGQLEWIGKERQKKAQQDAKKQHSRRRRSQFAQNYDQLMLSLIERDGYKCAVCGSLEDLTIDHVSPLSKGGGDELENLKIYCRSCNSAKGDR